MQKNNKRKLELASCERGGVLLLVTIMFVMLAGFAALATDLYRGASTHDQVVSFNQMAALGALEAYYNTSGKAESDRILEVEKNVEAIFKNQFQEGPTLLNSDAASSIRVGFQTHDSSFSPLAFVSEPEVVVQAGTYVTDNTQFTASYGASATPPSDCTSFPCFVPQRPGDPVSSFRVITSLPDFEYSGFINAVTGNSISTLSLTSVGVSTVVPRVGCFLVDLSPSATRQTHPAKNNAEQIAYPDGFVAPPSDNNGNKPGSLAQGHGTSPAYILSRDNWQVDDSLDDPFYLPSLSCLDVPAAPDPVTGTALDWDNWYDDILRSANFGRFLALECAHTTRDIETRVGYNFADDYTLMQVVGDALYSTVPERGLHPDPVESPLYSMGETGLYHLVQTRGQNPEPFTTILNGLGYAVEEFEARNVSGDRLCLMFYDSYLGWSRTVEPTNDYDYLKSFLIEEPGSPCSPFANDVPLSSGHDADILNTSCAKEKALRYGIFPGYGKPPAAGYTGKYITGAESNLPQALMAASNLVYDATQELPASAFIAVFGDGLTNCRFDGDCTDGSGCICDDTLAGHRNSVQDMYTLAEELLIDRQIPLHVFLMGESVNPHIIYHYEDGRSDGECLSEEEVRGLDSSINSFVKGNTATPLELETLYSNKNDSSLTGDDRWYDSNQYLYNLVRSTRGIWAPIMRNPVDDSSITSCETYEDICADTGAIDRPAHRSRRTIDPNCESRSDQIERYVAQIIGDNPFVIAEIK